jgi:hypothetical protein
MVWSYADEGESFNLSDSHCTPASTPSPAAAEGGGRDARGERWREGRGECTCFGVRRDDLPRAIADAVELQGLRGRHTAWHGMHAARAAAGRGTDLDALHGLEMAAHVHLVGVEQYGLRGRRKRSRMQAAAGARALALVSACCSSWSSSS